jgi:hypothetical protein
VSERCPLREGEHRIEGLDGIPKFCEEHCQEEWREAIRTQVGDLDWYEADDEDCKHELHEVVHSHGGLIKPNGTSDRLYSDVDECEGCRVELMETTYTFKCPYN